MCLTWILIMLVTQHEVIDGECQSWKFVSRSLKIQVAFRMSSRPFSHPDDALEIIRAARNSFAIIDWHFHEYQPDICSRIRFHSQWLFALTAIISSSTVSTKSPFTVAKVISSNIDYYFVPPRNPSLQLIINSFRIPQTDFAMLILQGWLTLL